MNIENLFKNKEQIDRDASGTAEFLANDKTFDDFSEEVGFKEGAQAGFREGIEYAIAIIGNHQADHMVEAAPARIHNMEKKDSIKFENAAIRAAGSRMANMFQPRIPMGPGEHEGYKEARRAFYEGFQEGSAFYRLLISRIDDEFANLIEGVRLDSGSGEDTHSVMEMCMKNGIPVITAVQKASGKNEREKMYQDLKNFIATVPLGISLEDVKKYAEEHTMESEPEEPKKDEPAVADEFTRIV